jgi:hypothetical protein
MAKISDSLDYTLESVEDRLMLVNKLLNKYDDYLVDYYDNHYNPHLNQIGLLSENTRMGKDLETIASYLLYAKDSNAKEDTITDYKKKRNIIREASIDTLIKIKEHKRETNKSIIKVPKIKVTKADREMHPELAETGKAIENLTRMIKTGLDSKGNKLSNTEINRLKWMRTDIQKDEVVMKCELKKYVQFQSITKSEPDRQALSYIRFDDKDIIRILIEEYGELKEKSYDDTFGYLKLIMFVFEDLVDQTKMKDYMRDILIWKIENVSYNEMINSLKEKYGIKLTKPRISQIIREVIPSLIVETYKQQKEDWLYTFIYKGEYKTCANCKQNYLATTKYFYLSKNGLRSICKKCKKAKKSTAKLNQ